MAVTMTRRIKRCLAAVVARLLKRPRLTVAELAQLPVSRVLIVRQHNQMGDMVCATPALRALREKYPSAHLTLVTSPVNGAVVQNNPHLDEVLMFAQSMWRQPWRLARFLKALRGTQCELAFVLGSVSFSVTSAVIALASGARWIVGPDSLPYGWDISRHIFALEMPSSPVVDQHAVEHGLAPLCAIGIDTADHTTVVVPSPTEQGLARQVMTELELREGFWALHPGAGKWQNVWPPECFAEVAQRAVQRGQQVLVLHGPADGPYLEAMLTALGPEIPPEIKVAPPLTVGVGAALLVRAERFLCNDTGVMHVAGAVDLPTLALFGPTNPRFWKPPSKLVQALCSSTQSPDPRGTEFGWMENLMVEDVWQAWLSLPRQPRSSDPD